MTQIIQMGPLALAVHTLARSAASVPAPIHHLVAIDISGSMYSDLPELRNHLKNKLTTLVNDGDTVSLIWFSGRGQFGTLVRGVTIDSAVDLANLHKAIDRYLKPTGLTGFKEPLQEMSALIDALKAEKPGYLVNFFFMSDGYDNCWREAEILTVCAELSAKVDSAVVAEYGYSCNRPLLTKMAEVLGGALIFSSDFESYVSTFESSLKGSTKRVPVKLAHPVTGAVFAVAGGRLLSFPLDGDTVYVPEGLSDLAYFTSAAGTPFDHKVHTEPTLRASLLPLINAGDTNKVYAVLAALGDVALIEAFTNCFSKEDFSRFADEVLASCGDTSKRYVLGYDPKAVPKEDAYTVIDLLGELSSDEENKLYPYHPLFSYKRTTAGQEDKEPGLKFTPNDKSAGYPVNGLVWNEHRPNVSLRVRVEGSVALPADRPAVLPAKVDSFIYRNYTIIKDGIVHTRSLPVSLSQKSFGALQANGLLAGETWVAGHVYGLNFPKVPVINRAMVKDTTAKETFADFIELLKLKGTQKVFNEWRKIVAPKESKDLLATYGDDATTWLQERGVTEFNGFNPPSVAVKSGDVNYARELKFAAKGLSSLPKVEDVENAIEAGKTLKPSELLMADACKRVAAVLALSGKSSPGDNERLAGWLEIENASIINRTRELTLSMAKRKFAVVVGQIWFSDLGDRENTTLTVADPLLGNVTVTATLKTVEYEI
ncbi:hypothetical protein [Comamonas thiooxydans]|uniref:hypothetical protein n=1 Tax=Comamonas thiooxydans TaxID=363952 RepID=UPI000B41DEB6|nr:hypothetical protein [Comamonas thiooxydans]